MRFGRTATRAGWMGIAAAASAVLWSTALLAQSKDRWTVPVGGFGRVFKIGKQPVSMQLTAPGAGAVIVPEIRTALPTRHWDASGMAAHPAIVAQQEPAPCDLQD
ncbi:hypothetical protein [Microvirga puerhi]|uniref:Uncharacterized protein n=1 Tax=Microvirga puerhi TaxID=2876078 RepID=A0ABS7VRC5_9HYPH|nr:hypothetical protein [Microvirga puerhi]MBZ6078080.1 hypothetical protein [Microvirga puerhi]